MDLDELRDRPERAGGPRYWRSLEELAGSPELREQMKREFPALAEEWDDPESRRHFLKLMGASLALAGVGVSGCAFQPAESIVPYVKAPEEVVPGRPLYYATAAPADGLGIGILVESHEGRPTKIEGNPDHPASLGSADPMVLASILDLYDPDRSRVVTRNGRVSTWDDFQRTLIIARGRKRANKGAGLRILTEAVSSPTLRRQLDALLKDFPEAKWHVHEPVGRDNTRRGAVAAFGEAVETVHDFGKADIVVALDADFLAWGPARLKDARAFGARREPRGGGGSSTMNRLYVAEPTPTITGGMADHRLRAPARRISAIARAIAREVGVEGVQGEAPAGTGDWIKAVVDDLKKNKGRSLVLVGETQPPEVHALAHAINASLENVGKTLDYYPAIETGPSKEGPTLADLVRDIEAAKVDLLLILGGNPVYDSPADVDMAGALGQVNGVDKVETIIHLGLANDETAERCHWHVPAAHYLEAWGDVLAFDGSATIQQPLIAPLYGGKSAIEILAVVLGDVGRSALDIVRETWTKRELKGDFDTAWRKALHDGVVDGTAAKAKKVSVKGDLGKSLGTPAAEASGLELVFRPDPSIWDGRYANNGWLQELPKPFSKLTWDNAVLMSPSTARRLGVKAHDVDTEVHDLVELEFQGRKLRAAVFEMPGQTDDSITLTLGYGRTRGGRVADGAGFNAYALRTTGAPWFGAGLAVRPTGTTYKLASRQHHFNMVADAEAERRGLIRRATLEEFRKEPKFASEPDAHITPGLSMYPEPPDKGADTYWNYQWGMAINLNTCIGCNACVIGCQSENNIPIVGKEEVLFNRDMLWIRVDTYFEGPDADEPAGTYHQPVPCMHCEKAPCELVCPVGATVHDAEGLNVMVYNRCVGTRYCGNNCPYKVRRFNFLEYNDLSSPSLKLLRNPDVTVRSRGVMEKCSYCIQRITKARIEAESQDRPIRDGEFQTACQQACPTRAIVFGNINDEKSAVSKARADDRNYALLAHLNTRPRTTYTAKLTNPNPTLSQPHTKPESPDGGHRS
jgi:molybdopterin-containing oxidoreductase family iron-sulfur binding subunit